jgi:hypothetical protein
MAKPYNVFLSWSGSRSKIVGEALREWLPLVIHGAQPFLSSEDIEKGSRGIEELTKVLETCSIAIICLTPENLNQPWILFESGAISKTIKDKAHVCTFLLRGMSHRDLSPPLNIFQATTPEKKDVMQLLRTLNTAIGGDDPIPEGRLQKMFEGLWSGFESELSKIPEKPTDKIAKRSAEDNIANVYEAVLGMRRELEYFVKAQQEMFAMNRALQSEQNEIFTQRFGPSQTRLPDGTISINLSEPKLPARFAVTHTDGRLEYVDADTLWQSGRPFTLIARNGKQSREIGDVASWIDLNTGEAHGFAQLAPRHSRKANDKK